MQRFETLENLFHMARGGQPAASLPVEGRVSRPHPVSTMTPIKFLKPWHLQPWKRSNLLEVALSDDGTDDTGASWTDVVNNLITQAGTVFTAKNLPAGSMATVPRPATGQVVPRPMPSGGFLGLSTNQLLIGGAVVLGGLWMLKRRR